MIIALCKNEKSMIKWRKMTMKRKMPAEFMLLITALIWGVAFVAQRSGMEYIGPFTFNGIRCLIGVLVLLPVIMAFGRQRKKQLAKVTEIEKRAAKRHWSQAVYCVGSYSSYPVRCSRLEWSILPPGKSGFITALYIVLVPILGIFEAEGPSDPMVLRGIGDSGAVSALHQRRFFHRERDLLAVLLCPGISFAYFGDRSLFPQRWMG